MELQYIKNCTYVAFNHRETIKLSVHLDILCHFPLGASSSFDIPPVALLLELYYASVFYIFFFVVLKLALNNLLQGCFSSSGFLAGLGSDIDFGLIRFDQPVCWAATVSIPQGGRVHYWHEEDYTLWEVGQNISFNDKETSYASSSGLGRNAMIHYMYALRSSSYLSHKILNGGNNDNHKLNETDLCKDR